MEDHAVLGAREAICRFVERGQVDILRAAVGVAELGARQREGGAQLDDRENLALQRPHAVARRSGERGRATEGGR
jgi:hypothetical protein